MGQPALQQTTITQFPIGEVDVIVYQWDYSGSSPVQLELEDAVVLAEESRTEAASAGQVESIPVVAVVEQSTIPTTNTVLQRDELVRVLRQAEWPEVLIPEAVRVSFCESGYTDPITKIKYWRPTAIGDSGRSVGLFQ